MSALGPDATAVVYLVASRILDYPDARLVADLPLLRAALGTVPAAHRAELDILLDHLGSAPLVTLSADYVATFDLRRRCCLYLSYYAYGDTRKRGMALLAFKQTYRRGKVEILGDELPDHLCVVLEFAATAHLQQGRKLLLEHRAGLEMLRIALRESGSPYAHALAAVSQTLPPLAGDERDAVARLAAQGPPGEDVGLEPFAPPDLAGARP